MKANRIKKNIWKTQSGSLCTLTKKKTSERSLRICRIAILQDAIFRWNFALFTFIHFLVLVFRVTHFVYFGFLFFFFLLFSSWMCCAHNNNQPSQSIFILHNKNKNNSRLNIFMTFFCVCTIGSNGDSVVAFGLILSWWCSDGIWRNYLQQL